jgi:DNA invertase Pin-like site-specific DNA recombinase
MLRKLLVLLAEMEREKISGRTKEKAISMIQQGYWTGTGI